MKKINIKAVVSLMAISVLVAGFSFRGASATVPGVNQGVDKNTSGSAPNGTSSNGVSISQNGRYVAFISTSTNLVSGVTVTGNHTQVYVRDRLNNSTSIASVSSTGTVANADNSYAQISADGRYVVFASQADNLTSGSFDAGYYHIFRHDMQTGNTILVDTNSSGTLNADSNSFWPSINADGNYVVFQETSSNSTNLVSSPTLSSGSSYAFEKNISTGAVTLLSIGTGSTAPNGSSYVPLIDCGGDKIIFQSVATNLVASDTNGKSDVFLKDTVTGTITDITQSGNDGSYSGSMSCDGDYFGVLSNATNLNSDTINNAQQNAFEYDRINGSFKTLSKSSGGSLANDLTDSISISDDGKYVVFDSAATNLVSGINDGKRNIFLRNVESGTTELISQTNAGAEENADSYIPSISADNRYVAYTSGASNLVSGYSQTGKNLVFASQSGASDDY